MKPRHLLFALVNLIATHAALAEAPYPLDNIHPSITEEQERRYFNDGIFVRCKSDSSEKRRYQFVTKPVLGHDYEIAKTDVDITAWVLVPGMPEPLEAGLGTEITAMKRLSPAVTVAKTKDGQIVFMRQKKRRAESCFRS